MPGRSVLLVQFISPDLGDFVESELIADDLNQARDILVRAKENPQQLSILRQRFLPSRADFERRYAPQLDKDGSLGVALLSDDMSKQYVQTLPSALIWTVRLCNDLRTLVPGFHLAGQGYVIARVPRLLPSQGIEEYLIDA
jgi:hypothetical protein